ncbi:hypothetical protein BJ170DRAFT_639940 [Xylariales sp. AK1849]|nr:hypothetical protein BJ170DRAFT_639940 [Xylariales sp. AK1849]
MARTARRGPQIRPQPGSHPRSLLAGVPGLPYEGHFKAEVCGILVAQIEEDAVIMIPADYTEDPIDEDPETIPWLGMSTSSEIDRVWRTTTVYEQIGESHPRIARFLHRDPFTGFPLLAKPSGPLLAEFLVQHRSIMYSESHETSAPSTPHTRVLPKYRPLIYQWALHLISGLSFVHSHSIIFGDLCTETCWLSSPSFSLSLVGFVNAGFRVAPSGYLCEGDSYRSEPFHPLHLQGRPRAVPTMKTDLFLWGCLVYELMTSLWPGQGVGRSDTEIQSMVTERRWPGLERQYLGDVVRNCWEYAYENAAAVKSDLVAFLNSEGLLVDGAFEDELEGFRADELFSEVELPQR